MAIRRNTPEIPGERQGKLGAARLSLAFTERLEARTPENQGAAEQRIARELGNLVGIINQHELAGDESRDFLVIDRSTPEATARSVAELAAKLDELTGNQSQEQSA